jgi:hypothetical protein
MIKRICTFAILGALALSVSGCDKCGDFFRPQGPFGSAVCKSDAPR